MSYQGPDPVYGHEMQPFWEGLLRHEFLLLRCRDCDEWRWPWGGCRTHQNAPYLGNIEWTAASGEGSVFTFSVVRMPFRTGFVPPYTYGIVKTDEGPIVPAGLLLADEDGADAGEAISVGDRVQVTFNDVREGLVLPAFVRS